MESTEGLTAAMTETGSEKEKVHWLSLPAWAWVILAIAGGTAFHIVTHYRAHGAFNVHQIGLALFLVINVLINFWEIGLFVCKDRIREEYEATKEPYRGRELVRSTEMFAARIPLHRVWRFSHWTGIWSTYALFDPGYASKRSFGFNIDVGNGISTVVPAAMFAFGMTFHFVSARVLGIIGVVSLWQMFYGTVLYFFQFFHNGRHRGHSVRNIVLFVGGTNGLWFVFPVWGMIMSVWMILNDSYQIFY